MKHVINIQLFLVLGKNLDFPSSYFGTSVFAPLKFKVELGVPHPELPSLPLEWENFVYKFRGVKFLLVGETSFTSRSLGALICGLAFSIYLLETAMEKLSMKFASILLLNFSFSV